MLLVFVDLKKEIGMNPGNVSNLLELIHSFQDS